MSKKLKTITYHLSLFINSLTYDLIALKATHIKIILTNKKHLEILFLHDGMKIISSSPSKNVNTSNKKINERHGFSFFHYLYKYYLTKNIFVAPFVTRIMLFPFSQKKTHQTLKKDIFFFNTNHKHKHTTIDRIIMKNILCNVLKKVPKFFIPFYKTEISIIIDDKQECLLNKTSNEIQNTCWEKLYRLQSGIKLYLFEDVFIKKTFITNAKVLIYGFRINKPTTIVHIYTNNYYVNDKNIIKKVKIILKNYSHILRSYILFIFISFKNKKEFDMFNKNQIHKIKLISKIIYKALES